ncbi:hypothetical protein [Pedobacter borealis]|uniref:hypothetical protein n=1 Tax=Pedobacter borealis TaxID=475254 RepID=UPI00049334F9|nr:hypothetical protein [Pedobacter borealis]
MKKIILALFLMFSVTVSFASNPKAKNETEKKQPNQQSKTSSIRQVNFYYILFEDGCFHLGYEQAEADGTWWYPCENDPSSQTNFKGMTFVVCPYTSEDMGAIC